MTNFQTPTNVADYMVGMSYLKPNKIVLEPTPGNGNIVQAIRKYDLIPIVPENDFWKMIHERRYDAIIMNPPFTPMKLGYKFLYKCMELTDEIIALMPWLTIINGEKRTKDIMDFGLSSITHLPGHIFKGSRVQCCILHMVRNWDDQTSFINFQ